MEAEERIAKWERVTIRFAGFLALSVILFFGIAYGIIEGVRFLIDRFWH